MARKKSVQITSPIGVAKYPHLNKPDTKFNADGMYKVTMVFEKSEVGDFLDMLDELMEKSYQEAVQKMEDAGKGGFVKHINKYMPYKDELDNETGEPTGRVEMNMKTKAMFTKNGKTTKMSPDIFDAEGKPVDRNKVFIWGGSELRVNFTPRSYYMASNKNAGVSLYINAVQIIELVTKGGNADGYGFGAVDGGFSADSYEGDFEVADNTAPDGDFDPDAIDDSAF